MDTDVVTSNKAVIGYPAFLSLGFTTKGHGMAKHGLLPCPYFSALQKRLGKAWKSTAKIHMAVQSRVVPRTDVMQLR